MVTVSGISFRFRTTVTPKVFMDFKPRRTRVISALEVTLESSTLVITSPAFRARPVFRQAGALHAALFLQVESLGAFGADVQPADPQITAADLLHDIALRAVRARSSLLLRKCGARDQARRRDECNYRTGSHGSTSTVVF